MTSLQTALVLTHGGVGAPDDYSDGCAAACKIGQAQYLSSGLTSAILATTKVLEDDPRFNAGTGSRLRLDGRCQMDAAIATSENTYGAVACIEGVKNPIEVAWLVTQKTPHRLICGPDATTFARQCQIPPYNPVTAKSLERLQRSHQKLQDQPLTQLWGGHFKGTIGAVFRAADGKFAATCSTGGTALMLPGRVGDSPLLGAGLYAGPLGAICCTGDGELIQSRLSAFRIYQALEQNKPLKQACEEERSNYPTGAYFGVIAVSQTEDCIITTHSMPRARLEFNVDE